MKTWILVFVAMFLLLSACSVSKQNTSSIMKADYGMLRLVGDPSGRVVTLDGNVIPLDSEKKINVFELKSGTYTLVIKSGDKVLLSQKLLIANSQTNEVLMP
jgi:hypothetical protein